MSSSDESSGNEPVRQQIMRFLAAQFPRSTGADHQFGADRLLAIFNQFAARVRAEAEQRLAASVAKVIDPDCAPTEPVEWADALRMLTAWLSPDGWTLSERRVRAEAIAAERQRLAEAIAQKIEMSTDLRASGARQHSHNAGLFHAAGIARGFKMAAGSVPVATPEPEDSRITNQSGHEFTFTVESRGEGMNWSHTMVPQTVRAWNLRDAIAVIAALPFASWFPVQGDEPLDEVVCPSCGTRIRARMSDTQSDEQPEER